MTIQEQRALLVTLITPNDLLVMTNIYPNTEQTQLKPIIYRAQEQYIKSSLGVELYDSLMAEWIAANQNPLQLPDGTTNPNGINYKTLYASVKPYLIWQSYVETIITLAVKIGEKGVYIMENSETTPVDMKMIAGMEQRGQATAKIMGEQLDEYLKLTFRNDPIIISAEPSQVQSPSIFLPSRHWKRCGR